MWKFVGIIILVMVAISDLNMKLHKVSYYVNNKGALIGILPAFAACLTIMILISFIGWKLIPSRFTVIFKRSFWTVSALFIILCVGVNLMAAM
jgi:hypothetical protein